MLCLVSVAVAQDLTNPPQAAEDVRQYLFDAQVALMNGDTDAALSAIEAASQLYQSALTTDTRNEALESAFYDAHRYGQDGDAPALAAIRSQIWTGLLESSTHVVYAAIEREDTQTATLWLPLRDFRVSTRFSRPGANATLAVEALANGNITPDEALAAVRADLLDTYQAQLTASLADVDEAHTNGFALRRAEEAGLAAGYFAILAESYGQQRGETALADANMAFEALTVAALTGDDDAFVEAYAEIDTALEGFRAAPLSEEELARRAGQLMRFLSLVPVEYERGVRNGVVTNDIEIQEALTFHAGALAAFTDLQAALAERDPQAASRVEELFAVSLSQIRDVAEPGDLRATTDEASQLLTATLPEEWLQASAGSDFDVILSVLDQVVVAAAQGEYQQAESARLEAYALLELGVEQRLRGFVPDMALRIESLFWQGTNEHTGLSVLLASQASTDELNATLAELQAALSEARLVLDSARSAPEAVVGNAAVIVFREGLEAVLILASLLASLRAAEERRFRRPLVMGAVLALVASAITWWLANNLLTLLLPFGERLEAFVSLIAIAVLLLITNWFFHHVYWTGWMANFHARKRRLIGGVVAITVSQAAGLVLLGFTSVYREGFETVLFLQSLVLEAGVGVVMQGVLLGLAGTALVGALTFALQVRLPYKKMLVLTGVMIGFVLLTMVGHTVHVMQSIGWLPITPIQGVFVPYWMGQWFGLFATWQGITLQITAAVFVIGSYFLAEHRNKRNRQRVRSVADNHVLV
jgi:high-affinity iron transporter